MDRRRDPLGGNLPGPRPKVTFSVRKEILTGSFGRTWEIALVSDLHLGWPWNRVEGPLAHLLEDPPDVVAVAGDLYDFPWAARSAASFLSRLADRMPVALVAGNHDRLWGRRTWDRLGRIEGCADLARGPLVLGSNGPQLELCGLERARSDHSPTRTRVVVHHHPGHLPSDGLPGTALALCGHLHGGQVVLHRRADGTMLPGGWLWDHCSDRARLGPTTLVVGRGLGDTLPVRVSCPREVVRIRLEAGT